MAKFEIATILKDNISWSEKLINEFKMNEEEARNLLLPIYSTKGAAGADFKCAEKVTIPSIFSFIEKGEDVKPTLIHTGIKANLSENEVLYLYNRSSNPKKKGLILANSVGVIDSDYYSNPDNDGEIMFAFYNIFKNDITIEVGERIGQGVFQKIIRDESLVSDVARMGGFGSTN